MIFCAAGDPGGSRALLPVILELERRGTPCTVLRHGFLGKELPAEFEHHLCSEEDAPARVKQSRCFLFGSSATDTLPLSLARTAHAWGVPTAHILDNWTNYGLRLHTDGLPPLYVDLYAVMDEEALAGAVVDGVPKDCLVITGHPGMAQAAARLASPREESPYDAARRLGLPAKKLHVAFINEPFRAVMGADIQAPHHPGFTEDAVLDAFTFALLPWKEHVHVTVLPHPKDNDAEVADLWTRVDRGILGQVLRLTDGRDILPAVDGVAGMASILLYEAWLSVLPVLSLQPNCRLDSMRRFSRLTDVHYAGTLYDVASAVDAWMAHILSGHPPLPRAELGLHASAPARLADVLLNLMKRRLS